MIIWEDFSAFCPYQIAGSLHTHFARNSFIVYMYTMHRLTTLKSAFCSKRVSLMKYFL